VKRFRNKRREVLERVAEMKRVLANAARAFTVESRVYESGWDAERGNFSSRSRRPEEYPESREEYWGWLEGQAMDLEAMAAALRELATRERGRMCREEHATERVA
jgi:hypothetical protein